MNINLNLDQFHDVYDAIKHVKSMYKPYPSSPAKPRLAVNHSVADAKQYASDLEKHTKDELNYKRIRQDVSSYNSDLDNELEKFIKKESGLDSIPAQYQDKVWSRAWDQSHSSGYGEVYGTLCNLVDIFK